MAEARDDHRRTDETFRLLVENVRDYAIFVLDPTGHVATWNQGAERIKGYAADEIVGRHFSVFYPPEDVAGGLCEEELEDAQKYGRVEAEGWRLRKDGSRFWATVVITALYDDDGTLRGFGKVTRDITERRMANQAIREHERLLAETQRLARLGSWEWDMASGEVTWSEELFRIFGVDAEEFEPSYDAYLARLQADDREIARGLVQRCIDEGEPYSLDHRIMRPDGVERWVEARGRALTDDSGRVVCLQGTAQDVTDVRQATEAREQLSGMRMRQQHALEVNDDIIQGLAVADLALNLEDYDKARESIASTLMAARRFVTDLLGTVETVPIAPGDLRRRSPDRS